MGVVIPGRSGNESFARAVSGPYQRCDDNCCTLAPGSAPWVDWTLGLVAGRRQQKGVGGRQAGRVTRRVETAGIERCEKHPTSSGDEVGGGVWTLFWYR